MLTLSLLRQMMPVGNHRDLQVGFLLIMCGSWMSLHTRSPSSKPKGSQLNLQKPEIALLNKSGKQACHKSRAHCSPLHNGLQ